ncbi:hypothetical protein BB560_004419, partial [Smittium megazygosporum]
ELPLLENIRKMHSACKSRPGTSLSVLALVSQVYTVEQLKDFGFEFSSNQYYLSRKNASEDSFTLVGYERHSSTSKTKRTDVCNICAAGEKIKKKYDMAKGNENASLEQIMRLREFEEVNLWSDSGPHFKNADYLYSVCLGLPQIFSSMKFKLDYFMENHGKIDVDGHFGGSLEVVQRDPVSAFREKAQVSENIPDNSRVYNFQIYRKDAIRRLRIRAKNPDTDPSKYFNKILGSRLNEISGQTNMLLIGRTRLGQIQTSWDPRPGILKG